MEVNYLYLLNKQLVTDRINYLQNVKKQVLTANKLFFISNSQQVVLKECVILKRSKENNLSYLQVNKLDSEIFMHNLENFNYDDKEKEKIQKFIYQRFSKTVTNLRSVRPEDYYIDLKNEKIILRPLNEIFSTNKQENVVLN